MKISDQIRHAIQNCGLTRYRIAKEANISQSTLSRFMNGHAMSTDVLDRLTELLGLSMSMTRPRQHLVALGSPRARWGQSRKTSAEPDTRVTMVNGRPVNPKLVAGNAPLPDPRPSVGTPAPTRSVPAVAVEVSPPPRADEASDESTSIVPGMHVPAVG